MHFWITLHAVSQVQYERRYTNYMLLMCVCFLLALYQHLANTTATKEANTKLHELVMHLHALFSVMGVMPLLYFFRLCFSLTAYLVQCPVH